MLLPRAWGEDCPSGQIKRIPQDFFVDELLDLELGEAGRVSDGEFVALHIEKIGANTQWVADQLARFARLPARAISYSGMKDRQAVTRQWFSVHLPGQTGPDWSEMDIEGVTLLTAGRHLRKLRRGSHRRNRFRIVVRETESDKVIERFERACTFGVPNYFGVQRFGHDGRNLGLVEQAVDGRRLKRAQRSRALSVARAAIFNQWLAEQVAADDWRRAIAGGQMMLAGSQSLFVADDVAETQQRIERGDASPTGPLPGLGDFPERQWLQAGARASWLTWLERMGVESSRRRLVLPLHEANHERLGPTSVALSFELERGGYATAVLRELVSAAGVDTAASAGS